MRVTVNELRKNLDLKEICVCEPDREIEGGYIGDLLSWVMGKARSGDVWITIMSNINIVAVASLTDVACIVLAEGVTVEENIINTARSKDINILMSSKSAFEIASEISKLI